MLNVHRLRLLLELRNRGTILQVARALSYSPSAISQQLAQLENETGVPLLEPAGRGVKLTPAALSLCQRTEEILAALEVAEAELIASAGSITGRLKVGFFQTLALVLAPEVLAELAVRHPELAVEVTEISSEVAFSALDARELDLVAGEEYPGLPAARRPVHDRRDFAVDHLRLVVPEVWASDGRLASLRDRPWTLEPMTCSAGVFAQRLCREAGFDPQVICYSSDLVVQMRLVASGLAAAIAPSLACATLPLDGVTVAELPEGMARTLYTVVHAGAESRPAIVAFRESLARCAGRLAGEAAGIRVL